MWLGVPGSSPFVVSVFAVTQHVNENILLKLHAVGSSHFYSIDHSFCIIAVHMNDRCLNGGSIRSTVVACSGVIKISSEPDLVV